MINADLDRWHAWLQGGPDRWLHLERMGSDGQVRVVGMVGHRFPRARVHGRKRYRQDSAHNLVRLLHGMNGIPMLREVTSADPC